MRVNHLTDEVFGIMTRFLFVNIDGLADSCFRRNDVNPIGRVEVDGMKYSEKVYSGFWR